MAKKKKRKVQKEPSSYKIEIIGLFLVLIAVIGIYPFGIVGKFLEGFAAFLVGIYYNVLFVFIAIIGLYMMIKREKPKFINSNLIGLYIMIVAILIMSHLVYKDYSGMEMVKKTVEDLGVFFKYTTSPDVSNGVFNQIVNSSNIPLSGSGIIGAAFCALSTYLLDVTGTKFVSVFLIIVGVIMFTGLSIYDVLKAAKEKTM